MSARRAARRTVPAARRSWVLVLAALVAVMAAARVVAWTMAPTPAPPRHQGATVPRDPDSMMAITDASGVAQVCYTRTRPGTETITASMGSVHSEPTEITWLARQTESTYEAIVFGASPVGFRADTLQVEFSTMTTCTGVVENAPVIYRADGSAPQLTDLSIARVGQTIAITGRSVLTKFRGISASPSTTSAIRFTCNR